MRKILIPLALIATLAIAATAYAFNVYTVSGSVSPTKTGSKKKPVPVGVKFGYTVGTTDGKRPTPIVKYSIKFAGLRVNTQPFAKCTFAQISQSNSDANCPAASVAGRGFIENAAGAEANPNDRSIPCNAGLTVYNSGSNKAVIFVKGDPNSTDPRTNCKIVLAAPIPANFISSASGTTLEFRVPSSLLRPAPGIVNAVTKVTSTITKRTKKVRGKTVGFFESTGGCNSRRQRNITVTFTPETGTSSRVQKPVRCTR